MSNATIAPALAEQWIATQLLADSALVALLAPAPRGGPGIYAYEADEGASYPLVTFAALSGVDTTALGMVRTLTRMVYVITAYGQRVGMTVLDPIAARIDAVIHGQFGPLPGGPILGVIRLNTMAFGESRQGVPYRRIAQTYQLHLKEGYPP